MNGEVFATCLFHKQPKTGNGQRLLRKCCKFTREDAGHVRSVILIYRARQCHVKSKVVHDVRITPKGQVLPLAFCQVLRPAPGGIALRQGGSKRLEIINDISGEILKRLMIIMGYQCKERTKCSHDKLWDIKGMTGRCKCLTCLQKIVFAVFFRKLERCF